ncbi:MAG: primosomal protein N' [Pseudomonadota bacterium]|nr:primosomal protein N' [Pseudomonadota bacterium]MDE3037943.1 primosomal protein N' [Pseudomonadota bacterium]
MKQVEILLPAAAPHGFDYRVPENMILTAGDIVTVPFGHSESLGVVWGAGKVDIPPGKIKSVRKRHEFPPLSPAMRQFIDWVAWYNCAPKGAVLKMALPISDIDKEPRKKKEAPPEKLPARHFNLAELSDAQKKATVILEDKIGKEFSVTLLDGVTGSGKTEVYFDAIAKALANESQILVLLPEIALSVQWLERFERRFGFTPAVWHSEITPVKKREAWKAIARGEAKVVVGARSALFLPYRNLALMIVDEEHDQSYKQEDGTIYHARDMTVARGMFEKLPIILVSATPSLESYHNAKTGKYAEVSLPARHGGAVMPDVEMIDMRQSPVSANTFISPILRTALAETIAQGHQAMLFLNRRGYAPLMLCRRCAHRFECPQCSSWMVMHKKRGQNSGLRIQEEKDLFSPKPESRIPNSYLACHYCNYRMPEPRICPACGAKDQFAACGPGVERVSEEVATFLPKARVAVMASDSMDGIKDMKNIISSMAERRIDLLIGTQMIAKGHHFAGLSVVGVVDADLGLSGGDPRAAERTYQLLHQLSGRAGREQVKGTVYLQSFMPEHPVMQALLSGDRETFLQAELQARRNADMPPFSRLASIIVEGATEADVIKTAKTLASSSIHHPASNISLLGPSPAPIYRLRGKYRYRLLARAGRSVNLPDFMRALIDMVKPPKSVRMKIDIDPVRFL